MPVDKQVMLRYQILNRCFRNRYREYTIDDLVNECNKELSRLDKQEVSKRTVQNDITVLESDYHIILNENLKQGRKRLYRYADTNYSLPLFRMNDNERNKIQAAIHVLDRYKGEPIYDWVRMVLMQVEGGLFYDDLSPVVSFQSNLDLKGIGHFSKLLQAIQLKRVLKLRYTPYGKDQICDTVHPYYLKQYNDRWFLIAYVKGYSSYAHYALDRIDDFEEVAICYQEPITDFNDYFDDVIGVTVPECASEDIRLRITKPRFEYIRTKPLHLSQRILEENKLYAIVSINVKINKELESLILSFGNDIEVLSPKYFRTEIADKIRNISEIYLNDAENLHT